MPLENLSLRLANTSLDTLSKRELRALLVAMLDGVRAVTAKLDADATVTDTNYTATFDAIVTK